MKPTLNQRLDLLAKAVAELREIENRRRRNAGPQLSRDHESGFSWQNGPLLDYAKPVKVKATP